MAPSVPGARLAGSLATVACTVRTDVYEGPFDVLLRLINERRVELYEVCLSDLVDDFLAEIEARQHLDLGVATEFLVIAATLVELKCRRLLPSADLAADEDDLALLEERDYLLARLVECSTFSGAGRRLAELELTAARSWPRQTGPDERYAALAPDLLAGVDVASLAAAASRALAMREVPRIELDHVLVDEVTVAEVVEALAEILPGCSPTTFRRLTAAARTRVEIVVHFLGLLELYKQGLVDLDQAETFGDLQVRWLGAARGNGGVLVGAGASLGDLDYEG